MTSQLSIRATDRQFSINATDISNQRLYEGIIKNANVSDEYLFARAASEADKDIRNSKAAKVYKALPTLTSAGLVGCCALIKPGPLSAKLATGAAMAGLFAAIDIGFKAYHKIKNKIQEKHDNQEQSEHSTTKTVLGIAGTLAAVTAGYFGITKGAAAFARTDLGTKAVRHLKRLGKSINTSWPGKKINTKAIDRFFEKHPITKNALFLTPIAGSLVGTSVLGTKLNKKFNNKVEKNFEACVQERESFHTAAELLEQSGLVQPVAREQHILKLQQEGRMFTLDEAMAIAAAKKSEEQPAVQELPAGQI